MRKAISLLLTGTIILSVMCGCSKNENPQVESNQTASENQTYEYTMDSENSTEVPERSTGIAYPTPTNTELSYGFVDHKQFKAEEIKTYQNMWEAMSSKATEVKKVLSENRPPEEYDSLWLKIRDYMGEIAALCTQGINNDIDGDGKYSKDEMLKFLKSTGVDILDLMQEACLKCISPCWCITVFLTEWD